MRPDRNEQLQVHPLGATVLSARPGGDELLWVSPNAQFPGAKTAFPTRAIRGGIPVCWPWFADDRPEPSIPEGAPAHGVARTRPWTRLDSLPGTARYALTDSDATRAWWPHPFRLVLSVTVDDGLRVTLQHHNRARVPVRCTGALHTYLRVADPDRAHIVGLDGARWFDKHTARQRTAEGPVRIDAPIDGVFRSAGPVELHDGDRRVQVTTSSRTMVVWNPGAAGAAAKADLGAGTHRGFVCIEAAVTGSEVAEIAPGAMFELTTTVRDLPGV